MIEFKDYPDTTTLVNAENLNDNFNELKDGWIKASLTAFTYSNSTRINTSLDLRAYIGIGDKVKYVQTTTKYGYVIAITSTYIDVTGGSDYTVANEPITEFYYSHMANPVGFPQWFNYTPTVIYSFGTTDPTSATKICSKFCINSRSVNLILDYAFVIGSGNRAQVLFTLPIDKASNTFSIRFASQSQISTTPTYGTAFCDDYSQQIKIPVVMNNNGNIRVTGSYPI